MAKRPTVEVDEEYLKRVMAGDVPLHERKDPIIRDEPAEKEKTVANEEKEVNPETVKTETVKEPVKASPNNKKKDSQIYGETFLKKHYPTGRKQTYVSVDIYEKISRFLPVIANQLSITVFIDNILSHHIEQYSEEIKELYNKETKNLTL